MYEKIGISRLRDIGAFYDGDLYDLARLTLKLHDAQDKGANTISRHTVNGLIKDLAFLARVAPDQVLAAVECYGLPLGATIEYDQDVK